MKFKYLSLIGVLLVLKFPIYSQTLLWTWLNDGAGPTNESVSDAVLDNSRNVYLTGLYSGANTDDIIVAKIAPNGGTLWTQLFDNGADGGISIALDNNNDVYVAGWSWMPNGCRILDILKYRGTDGYQYWSTYIELNPDVQNNLCKIAIDHSYGCGYVATQKG